MKKLKLCFSKVLCVMLCVVMLFGCGRETDGKETGSLPEQGNVPGQCGLAESVDVVVGKIQLYLYEQ